MTDPRPDLRADHHLWIKLLTIAESYDLALVWGVLHGLRCMGTRITTEQDKYVLRPYIHSNKGWETMNEYKEARTKYLLPISNEIGQLLSRLEAEMPIKKEAV